MVCSPELIGRDRGEAVMRRSWVTSAGCRNRCIPRQRITPSYYACDILLTAARGARYFCHNGTSFVTLQAFVALYGALDL